MSNVATQFKKGQSGNPNGRPKREWTWSGVLEEAVEEIDEDSGQTVKELVAKSLVKEARKGNVMAQKEIMNRMDGMPKQDIEAEVTINKLVELDTKPE